MFIGESDGITITCGLWGIRITKYFDPHIKYWGLGVHRSFPLMRIIIGIMILGFRV